MAQGLSSVLYWAQAFEFELDAVVVVVVNVAVQAALALFDTGELVEVEELGFQR